MQGHNEADTLANAGSELTALPDLLFQGHLLKRKIVMALQAMFVACYNRRQESRQALALETPIEREPEGQPTVGGEIVPPVGHVLLEDMFTPLQRNMTALAAHSLKTRFPTMLGVAFKEHQSPYLIHIQPGL